jgi:hypothetical protein
MPAWAESINSLAEQSGFAGVVSVDHGGEIEFGHEVTDYLLTVPAQDLATTGQYLAVLGGHPAKFPAGERFSYCERDRAGPLGGRTPTAHGR